MVKNNLEYRVTQIEKRLDGIDCKIDKMRTEDIPHMQAQLDSLSTKIMVLTGVNLTAIIIAILISRLVK